MALRRVFGWCILGLTAAQVVAVNFFFVLNAIGYIPWAPNTPFHVSDDLFKVFAVSIFASVLALGYGVTKSLFPGASEGIVENVSKLFGRKD
jgi:hypothetical protein